PRDGFWRSRRRQQASESHMTWSRFLSVMAGSSRPSTSLADARKNVDARHKAGHDEEDGIPPVPSFRGARAASEPGISRFRAHASACPGMTGSRALFRLRLLLHVGTQHGVDAALIALTFALKIVEHVLIDANLECLYVMGYDQIGVRP